MPRFHFEIVDGYTLADPTGMDLPTEEAAKKVAGEIAKQIADYNDDPGLTEVVVKNDNGEEIYKTAIKPQ